MPATPESTTKVYVTNGWTRISEVYPNEIELEGENPSEVTKIEKISDLHVTSFLMRRGSRYANGYVLSFDKIEDGRHSWESVEISSEDWVEQNYTVEWYGRIAQEAEKWLGSNDLVVIVS